MGDRRYSEFSRNPEKIEPTLLLPLGYGMLGIFAVIAVIIALTYLLRRVFRDKTDEMDPKE